ncbi:hypothetical protein P4576_21240 [Peribacillus frigoritolerans]|uniref:hypothetical protein n=1 Tax=Peribacillus frigoritolerans TaxID=450367 RepID=UPI002E1F5B02|nr:hypothetical protein [Peribacillus frigoritolerans]
MERKVRDSCGKSVSRGDPAGEGRGQTARGKQVPEVESSPPIIFPGSGCDHPSHFIRQKVFYLNFKTKLNGT